MNSKLKKTFSLIMASGVLAVSASAIPAPAAAVEPGDIIYSAECEELEDAVLWTSIYQDEFPGYSGEGFTYLTGSSFKATFDAPEEGMYEIKVRYVQILDKAQPRQQTIAVNGIKYKSFFPYANEWTDFSFGLVRLKEGENTIEFINEYGYAAYDTITVTKAEKHDYSAATGETCDKNATDETKALMKYLKSVYGKHIISGQQEIYGGGHTVETTITYNKDTDKCVDSDGKEYTIDRDSKDVDKDGNEFYWHCSDEKRVYTYNSQNRNYNYVNYDQEFDYIYELSGEYPAIRGFDFMNYNPLYGWDDNSTERAIEWVKKGGIATGCWHLNIPNDFGSYEVGDTLDWTQCSYKNNDTFSVKNAVIKGTKENEFLDLCIEDLAEQFLRLQEENVPIMFRPFHEAEGNGGLDGGGAWFWWAQDGAEAYKDLWIYLYNALTEDYGLHNIIWVQNLYAWSSESAQWYPGDEYVDIIGYDKYNVVYNRHDGKTSGPNEDAESGLFDTLFKHVDGKKMVAMPENDTVPSLSNLTVEDAGWLYFCIWYDNGQDNFVSGSNFQNPDTLKELYQSEYCITLDELPKNLYVLGDTPTTLYGDANDNGDVEVADAVFILQGLADPSNEEFKRSEQGEINADCHNTGNGVDSEDALAILKFKAMLIDELPYKN